MQTIKPSNKQIFAKPTKAETTTKSGIILADSAKHRPETCEVINIGSEVTACQPKDTVVYKKYASTEITLNNEDYLLIDEQDILGTVIEVL